MLPSYLPVISPRLVIGIRHVTNPTVQVVTSVGKRKGWTTTSKYFPRYSHIAYIPEQKGPTTTTCLILGRSPRRLTPLPSSTCMSGVITVSNAPRVTSTVAEPSYLPLTTTLVSSSLVSVSSPSDFGSVNRSASLSSRR